MNQHLHAGPAVNLLQQEGGVGGVRAGVLLPPSLKKKKDTLLRPVFGDPGDSSSALNRNLLHWMA